MGGFADNIARTRNVSECLYSLCAWLGLLLQTQSVSRSVGRSVTIVSPAITAEPIEMPFGCALVRAKGSMYQMGCILAQPDEYE